MAIPYDIEFHLLFRIIRIAVFIAFYYGGLLTSANNQTFDRKNDIFQEDLLQDTNDEKLGLYVIFFAIYFFEIVFLIIKGNILQKRVPRIKISRYRVTFPLTLCLDHILLAYIYLLTTNRDSAELIAPFIGLKCLYEIISSDLRFMCKYFLVQLWNFVSQYGCTRVFIYYVFIIVHSVFFVYIFYSFWEPLLYFIQYYSNPHHFVTLSPCDNRITHNHSFPTLLGNLNNRIYSRDPADEKYYLSNYYWTNTTDASGVIPPYTSEIFQRNLHEDVQFVCNFLYIPKEKSEKAPVVWLYRFETNIVNKSRKFETISNDLSKVGSLSRIPITSKLNIYDVNQEDYGEYSCNFHIWYRTPESHVVRDVIVARYLLIPREKRQISLHIPIGNSIFIQWCDINVLNAELYTSDITHSHRVNDQPIALQGKEDLNHCGAFPIFYHQLAYLAGWIQIYFRRNSDYPSYVIKTSDTSFGIWLHTCAYSNMFGIHTVSLLKEVFDSTSNRFVLLEIEHPLIVAILPETPYFLVNNKSNVEGTQREWKKYTSHFEEYILWLRVIFEWILFAVVVLLITYICFRLWCMYNRRVVSEICNVILRKKLCGETGRKKVAFFCSEEDFSDLNLIVDILEKPDVDSGMEIFLLHRDSEILGGKSILNSYGELLRTSEIVVILLTQSFIEDLLCLNVFLEPTLFQVKDGDRKKDSVLIIHGDHCQLPENIRCMLSDARILEWNSTMSVNERCRIVTEWMLRCKTQAVGVDIHNPNVVTLPML